MFGVLVFAAAYINIYVRQSHGESAAAVGMSDMHMNNMAKFWAIPIVQASGIAAIVAAYVSIILGLQQSRRAVGWLRLRYQDIDVLHRHVSMLVLVAIAIHAVATYLDTTGSVCRSAFWFNGCTDPWPDAVWAYNLGIFAFYLALLLGPTFYLRRKIGVKFWKYVHRFIIVFYIAAVWHTLILGLAKEDYPGVVRPLFWLLQIPVLWLMSRRFSELAKQRSQQKTDVRYWCSQALVVLSYAGMIFVLVVVVTSHAFWMNIT